MNFKYQKIPFSYRYRALVETKSPAELSEFNGLGDFPVPTRIENIFKKSATNDEIKSEIAAPKNFSGKNKLDFESGRVSWIGSKKKSLPRPKTKCKYIPQHTQYFY